VLCVSEQKLRNTELQNTELHKRERERERERETERERERESGREGWREREEGERERGSTEREKTLTPTAGLPRRLPSAGNIVIDTSIGQVIQCHLLLVVPCRR
jgi:hypothetical protein